MLPPKCPATGTKRCSTHECNSSLFFFLPTNPIPSFFPTQQHMSHSGGRFRNEARKELFARGVNRNRFCGSFSYFKCSGCGELLLGLCGVCIFSAAKWN